MGYNQDNTIQYLRAIEKKHKDYFVTNHLEILDCVEIIGTSHVTIHIKRDELPFEIKDDIETMFWKS